MDNAEEILQALEEFSKLKPKEIPKELDEYLGYVAKTGDPVYQWHLVKYLFHEKLLNVITEFFETSPTIDLPPCPNVDPFNYERMKTSLLERLDTFSSAPFTVQRICELLTNPRKQYNRVDKFMRAIEKNILVVSTREPGIGKRLENDQTESVPNGMPDSKINENDDRIVNVCSDNVQFDGSSEPHIPVENAVNACVIQEEIEIANSVPASTPIIAAETKSWSEENDDNKGTNLDVKTDLPDNSENNVVSTTSCTNQLPNNELPKNTNILFTESEIKDSKPTTTADSEPINSSTSDSPESPEPEPEDSDTEDISDVNADEGNESTVDASGSEDTCSDIKECIDEPSEQERNENIAEIEKDESSKPENQEEQDNELINSTDDNVESPKMSEDLDTNNEVNEVVTELKLDNLSPDNTQPDSSNDSYQSGGGDSSNQVKTSSIDVQIENENISTNEDNVTNVSDSTASEKNVLTEITDVTSSQISEHQDVEETTEELVVKEIDEEDETIGEDAEKVEDVKCTIEDSNEVNELQANEEGIASSDDCISIEEINDIKEETVGDVDNKERSNVVASSDEVSDEICEEQERREGSIIHVAPNVSGMDNEPRPETSVATVEDICVDQSSCGTEDEAMDVDETSNQQMVTSEGENEVEPMDQSEQSES